MVRQYLFKGAPYGLDESKLAMEHGRHNFADKEDQALCLDSLAGFAAEGFVVGPLPLDAIDHPKLIGAFTREQESSAKKRVISDLSQPRSGGSFNDALSKKPVEDWPMVNPGRVEDAIAIIIDNGRGAVFCKIDVSSAYKLIAIQKEQRKFQVYRFGNALFIDLCLLFGDATAAHIFTGMHRGIIENFVIPFINGSLNNLVLVVDDSAFISGNPLWVQEYNNRYRYVMETLHLGVKQHDAELRKTFLPSQQGEVLGYWLDSQEMTWTVSESKVADILRQTDSVMDATDLTVDRPVTLKQLQRVHGKFADWAKLSPWLKMKNMIIAHELARAEKKFARFNDFPEDKQPRSCFFSSRAKEDLRDLRAVAAQIRTHRLPLVDPRPVEYTSAEILVFCDASGDVDQPAYLGLLIINGVLHDADLALSYLLPKAFLTAKDEKDKNAANSFLLEMLCILALLLDLGPALTNRSILFTTDSLGLVTTMRNGRNPKGTNACFSLQTLREAASELGIQIRIKWKPRRSCPWTKAADDLSHADPSKISPSLTRDLQFRKLDLPGPLLETLLDAAENPATAFSHLRARTKTDWLAKGWCTHAWAH